MKPSEPYEALHALINERVPLHIWGACGVGKSQIVAQVAVDLNCDFHDFGSLHSRKAAKHNMNSMPVGYGFPVCGCSGRGQEALSPGDCYLTFR